MAVRPTVGAVTMLAFLLTACGGEATDTPASRATDADLADGGSASPQAEEPPDDEPVERRGSTKGFLDLSQDSGVYEVTVNLAVTTPEVSPGSSLGLSYQATVTGPIWLFDEVGGQLTNWRQECTLPPDRQGTSTGVLEVLLVPIEDAPTPEGFVAAYNDLSGQIAVAFTGSVQLNPTISIASMRTGSECRILITWTGSGTSPLPPGADAGEYAVLSPTIPRAWHPDCAQACASTFELLSGELPTVVITERSAGGRSRGD